MAYKQTANITHYKGTNREQRLIENLTCLSQTLAVSFMSSFSRTGWVVQLGCSPLPSHTLDRELTWRLKLSLNLAASSQSSSSPSVTTTMKGLVRRFSSETAGASIESDNEGDEDGDDGSRRRK